MSSPDGDMSVVKTGSRVKWEQGVISVRSDSVSTRAALRGVVDMCQQRSLFHERRADLMRVIELSLQIPMLMLASMTTVISTIIPATNICSMKPQIALALMSAISTILASILRLYDPGVRREEHQSCERMYKSLARDVAVKLVTFDDDAKDMTQKEYMKLVLRDCQCALDYIQYLEVEI